MDRARRPPSLCRQAARAKPSARYRWDDHRHKARDAPPNGYRPPDHQFGVVPDTVGKAQFDACCSFLCSDKAMAEMKATAIDTARQGIKQVGTMKRAKGSAETTLYVGVITIVERRTRMHIAREYAGSDIGRRSNAFAEPDRTQCPDRLRTDIYPRTDLAETRRCFEDVRRQAEFGKRRGGRQTGEAAANDGDTRGFCH
jgi:hypothetical protein